MKRTLKITVLIALVCMIVWVVYGFIMTLGYQKESSLTVPDELKVLQLKIQHETKSGYGTYFSSLSSNDLKDCNANQLLHLSILNDSLILSETGAEGYAELVAKRVNSVLSEKECIDSLIIELKVHGHSDKRNLTKEMRLTFAIK